jgi:hypothetical protein
MRGLADINLDSASSHIDLVRPLERRAHSWILPLLMMSSEMGSQEPFKKISWPPFHNVVETSDMKCESLTAVNIGSKELWDVKPCALVDV